MSAVWLCVGRELGNMQRERKKLKMGRKRRTAYAFFLLIHKKKIKKSLKLLKIWVCKGWSTSKWS